jgi:hypothetical protein
MSKRRKQLDGHVIVSRGLNVYNEPQVTCSCGIKCNSGIKMTADEVFQIHRDAASPNT